MKVDFMRKVDYYVGVPICFFLSILRSLQNILGLRKLKKDFKPKKLLFIELSEMGSTILAYGAMKKAKDLVMYFRTLEGSMLKKFQELDGSAKIRKYEELRDLVKDSSFRDKMKSKEFAGSDDAAKLAEFKQMDSSSEIRDYYKFRDSRENANFANIDGSSRLGRYHELKEYTSSKEFAERKELNHA